MKTAVQILIEELESMGEITMEDLLKAKGMEKEQIVEAYEQGDMVGRAAIVRELDPNDKVVIKYPEIEAEQYYKETYESKR